MFVGGDFGSVTHDAQFHRVDRFSSWAEHNRATAPADELRVNILKAGGDYGWPDYGYGRNNDSSPMQHPNRDGIEPALLVWVPGITPSGLLFYTGDQIPQWKNNLFVGGMRQGEVFFDALSGTHA